MVRKLKAQAPEPESELVIRDAQLDDLQAITEIYNYYILNSVVTFDIEVMNVKEWVSKFEYLKQMELPFLVAESSGQILGFAYLSPFRQKAGYKRTTENSIYLKPSATGKRVGTKLMTELLAKGKESGIKEVIAVISDQGSAPSIALHKRFGFKEQGRLGKVGLKFGKWLGTILFQRSL
jgi:phosphinothricin acetyltransferase